MTVSSSLSTQTFSCDGSTTVFTCPFRVLEASELVGYLITVATNESALLINGTDFSVTGVGLSNAIATTTLTYSSGYQVNFRRRTQRLQSTDYRDNDPFPAESHENALDRLTHIAQENDTDIGRALLAPEPETGITLPAAAVRAGRLLGFTSTGVPVAVAPVDGTASALALDLASANSATRGAGQVGYLAALAYPGGTVGEKLRQTVSVVDFGAVGNATGNIGAALQAAHDALGPDGGEILVPAASSYYLATTGAIFTKPIRLIGQGWFSSEILTTTAGITLITTSSRFDMENMHLSALGSARGLSTGVKQVAASATHGHSKMVNNYFDGFARCYWSERTNALTVRGCLFGPKAGYGLYLENLANSDEGDSFVDSNTFAVDDVDLSISIYVVSTAGVNICNNKFNTTAIGHLLLSSGPGSTGNFLVSNNSFEGHVQYAIKALQTGGGALTKVIITGNQFSSESTSQVTIGNDVQNVQITGNTFNCTTSASGTGIIIEEGATEVSIVGNSFHQILNGIVAASGSGISCGLTMAANRFAPDVTVMFAGDDGQSPNAPQREITLSRFVSNTSNADYVDAVRVIGYGTLEIKVYGLVQGAGVCNYYRRVLLSGSAVADIDAAVSSGAAFDVQLAAAGGYLAVGVKRNGATGTNVTVYVEVTARGQITDFRKA